jgi:methylenetetrahydrofolate dehydrogenase (NADP+)/methenyltetrahydrofolate cyclohydrolase
MDIKKISDGIRKQVASDVERLKAQGIDPKLAVILVGGDEASLMYAQTKKKVAEKLGIAVEIESFPADISQSELERKISEKSRDPKIHGLLLESPFPEGLDYAKALARVDPLKDIDGLHVENLGKLQSGDIDSAILPATPLACLRLMELLGGSVAGKTVVLVGSGRTVGKPLAMLLVREMATVIACNSRTKNVRELCLIADFVVSAVGKPGLITADMVHGGSVVIDVGTAFDPDGKMVGDADYEAVGKVAKFVTPVPGGVGTITTGIVFQNLVRAIGLQRQRDHFDLSMNDFFALASGPTMPGGGGISAVAGILGASMASMVFSLTRDLGNDASSRKIPELAESLKRLYRADIGAFDAYLAGLKLPKDTAEQKEARSAVLQAALLNACEIPLEFGEVSLELLRICRECAETGNKLVISDVSVAIRLIRTAVQSSFEAIDANLKSIRDEKVSANIRERKNRILEQAEALSEAGLSIVSQR